MGFKGIDHIDGNGLNNQRYNLRRATVVQNSANFGGRGISPYRGVRWHKEGRRWVVQIQVNGKNRHVGLFDDETEAAHAYDERAYEAWGSYARLNFPRG